MSGKDKFSKKLLVEGNDDRHVIWALCERFKVAETFDVIDCQGFDKLNEQIPVRFKQSGLDTLGIIIDADTAISSRWTSIRGLLTSQGFAVPHEIPSTGLVLHNTDQIKVGVWIMPNNSLNGMLEDFITFLIPKDDKLLPIAISTLDTIEEKRLNQYAPVHKSKALIHSWLAWQKDPGTPMGLGITKRYLTTDDETCSLLMNWLDEVFNK